MKKLSLAVVIATLGLAAPALAQTPADIRNNRHNSPLAAVQTEVKIERTAPVAEETAKTKKTSKKSKKSSKKHSKKHSKKAAEAKTETKTEEKK